jgi:hypothetical protein
MPSDPLEKRQTYDARLVALPDASGNSRKLTTPILPDLIDYLEPTMVIVGSRGLGKLKG